MLHKILSLAGSYRFKPSERTAIKLADSCMEFYREIYENLSKVDNNNNDTKDTFIEWIIAEYTEAAKNDPQT